MSSWLFFQPRTSSSRTPETRRKEKDYNKKIGKITMMTFNSIAVIAMAGAALGQLYVDPPLSAGRELNWADDGTWDDEVGVPCGGEFVTFPTSAFPYIVTVSDDEADAHVITFGYETYMQFDHPQGQEDHVGVSFSDDFDADCMELKENNIRIVPPTDNETSSLPWEDMSSWHRGDIPCQGEFVLFPLGQFEYTVVVTEDSVAHAHVIEFDLSTYVSFEPPSTDLTVDVGIYFNSEGDADCIGDRESYDDIFTLPPGDGISAIPWDDADTWNLGNQPCGGEEADMVSAQTRAYNVVIDDKVEPEPHLWVINYGSETYTSFQPSDVLEFVGMYFTVDTDGKCVDDRRFGNGTHDAPTTTTPAVDTTTTPAVDTTTTAAQEPEPCSNNCGSIAKGGGLCKPGLPDQCTDCNDDKVLMKGFLQDDSKFASCVLKFACEVGKITSASISKFVGGTCTCDDRKCQKCTRTPTGDVCKKCKGGLYLHEGACVDSCPSNKTSAGNRDVGRKCLDEFTCKKGAIVGGGGVCKCVDAANKFEPNCAVCDFEEGGLGEKCTKCLNSKVLSPDGTCVDDCSAYEGTVTYAPKAAGGQCRAPFTCDSGADVLGAKCLCKSKDIPGWKDCDSCDWSLEGESCNVCKNNKYLHNGDCVKNCPDGTIGRKEGRVGGECVPQ
eukprot:m.233736 g.233736  ORF g.233736 m.233736 type:complete len:666 (+) comp33646_c1_seq5:2-1999(+)